MKLLLTSAGITNKSLANALLEMIDKPINEAVIVFIPTAANVEEGDKDWLIDDLNNLRKLKPKMLDIVDISAIPQDIWEARIKEASIIVVGGGNTFHLMHHLVKSNLAKMLPELLESRVYVGISAGSIVTSKTVVVSQSQRLYSEEIGEYKGNAGLGFVDFHIRPHLNSPHFPKVRDKYLKEMAKEIADTVYAIDDDSAVKVINGKEEVISEGEWLRYN